MLPKRLVFCGGGTRCLVFVQALVELEKRGNLKQVSEYWGTSAGAMIASLYSITKSSTKVKELMFQTDYLKFRDIDISNIFGIQHSWGLDDGNSLVKEIERIFESIEPGSKDIRFSDMAGLNIVVSDLTIRETVVCNSHTFPNLRIIDAVRASMSLPIFFKPFIHKESGNIWVDGALRANFPWDLLPNDEARSESLGFTFEKATDSKSPKTFMEYIFSMVHFDEPKKNNLLKQKWSKNILWFNLPPYPTWYVRLQGSDFEIVESLGREGVEKWHTSTEHSLSKRLETHPLSDRPHIPKPVFHPNYTNELSGIQTQDSHPCSHVDCSKHHLPSFVTPHTQISGTIPSCRRWSV